MPLTRSLIDLDFLDREVLDLVVRMVDERQLPFATPKEALGAGLEVTVDQIRSMCASQDAAGSSAANDCLQRLIRSIAEAVSRGQSNVSFNDHGFSTTIEDPPYNYCWLTAGACLSPNWSIITLNYDCLLDFALQLATVEPKFPSPRQYGHWLHLVKNLLANRPVNLTDTDASYIKLHGSLYLYSCHNPACSAYREPFTTFPQFLSGKPFLMTLLRSVAACAKCGESAVDFILPPGKNKTFAEEKYYQTMRSVASNALSRSDFWILLGYSCPAYDVDVLDMFREAAYQEPMSRQERTILVVAPGAVDIAQRLVNHLCVPWPGRTLQVSAVHPAPETFSSFVKQAPLVRSRKT